MSRHNEILVELLGFVEDSKDPDLSDEELLKIKNAFAMSLDWIAEKAPRAARNIAYQAAIVEEVLIERKVPGAPELARRLSQGSLLAKAGKVEEALELFQGLLEKETDPRAKTELEKLIKWAKSKSQDGGATGRRTGKET